MRILYNAHWLIPWFIAAVGLFAIIKFVRGYLNSSAFTDLDRRLIRVYSGMLDLQATVGLVYFIVSDIQVHDFPAYRYFLHAIVMFAAVILPHFSALWNDENDATRYLNNFSLLLGSLLLIVLGLSLVPMK